jgi:hypothetical protein
MRCSCSACAYCRYRIVFLVIIHPNKIKTYGTSVLIFHIASVTVEDLRNGCITSLQSVETAVKQKYSNVPALHFLLLLTNGKKMEYITMTVL